MIQQTATSATDVVLRLVGESGEGTVSLGDLTVQVLASMGLDIYTFQTFPAEIKGGTVMYQIRARSGVVLSHGDAADVLVALNDEGFELFGDSLRDEGILLYDTDSFTPPVGGNRTEYALPITALARAEKDLIKLELEADVLKQTPAPKNIVGLGALLRLVDAPLAPAEQYIRNLFGRKGDAIVRMNIHALHTGSDYVGERINGKNPPRVRPVELTRKRLTVTGNQMIALGAIAAGIRYFAGYPITPATEIMETLAKELPPFGGDVIQAEDEIAATGLAIGASFAGKKAMTSTSGPGLDLMSEHINFAGQAEIPIVVVDVQRGGASTGMPTKTSQGDLNMAIYGVHNESPRVVMATASVEDCFWTTVEAVNIAEEYQCPVVVLSDQALGTRKCTVPPPDMKQVHIVDRLLATPAERSGGYLRFRDTDTGISPMSTPGMEGGVYTASGIEHDEEGDPGYRPELAVKMKEKRYRKMATLLKRYDHSLARTWGEPGEAEVGVIAFGSTEGVIREAVARAADDGLKVAHLHLRLLSPLPVDAVDAFAARCRKLVVAELNFTGQLYNWLKVNTNHVYHSYRKDEGLPFIPNEIYRQIVEIATGKEN